MHSEGANNGGWLTGDKIGDCVSSGDIVIDPFNPDQLNPNSYNYTLFGTVRRIVNDIIDLKGEDNYEEIVLSSAGTTLFPGECYLGCTSERLGSSKFASLITGRSSIGRKFVTNHITAGLIDVGFVGRITLEITVERPTIFYPGLLFGQIFWFGVEGTIRKYSGKYQSQSEPTLSRSFVDPN
jgi:dCTP deaminase